VPVAGGERESDWANHLDLGGIVSDRRGAAGSPCVFTAVPGRGIEYPHPVGSDGDYDSFDGLLSTRLNDAF
jgi:hypothetical protein